MFSPSDYNDAVPQFTNGNYANEPLNPLYVEEPDSVNYKKGAEPLQTLPVQWWNWLWNKITAKLNKLNIYVKNIFNELAGLLSLVNVTPDATEENVTTKQLKNMFATKYPQYLYDSDIFKTKYPQYLNNNFNFETLLKGRSLGVMVAPKDTWNNNTNTLSLTGGFGVIHTYNKVKFSNCNLVIPTDNKVHYIVSNPSGVISIENIISSNDILIGLCSNKQYCLLIDNNPDQCKDNIILKKWFGQHEISQNFVPALQSYYHTTIASIETNISIETISTSWSIPEGIYNNCTINIKTVSVGGRGVNMGTCNNCTINIGTMTNGNGIVNGTYNNCTITIEKVNDGNGILEATLNNCTINIGTVDVGNGIRGATINNSTITINTVSGDGKGISNGTLKKCTINIGMVNGHGNNLCGILEATINNSTINIGTVNTGYGISSGTLYNCFITINIVNNYGLSNCISDNCTINIENIKSYSRGISNGTYKNSAITIKTSNEHGKCIYYGTYNNCTINIETLNSGVGISESANNNCIITISKIINKGYGIDNNTTCNNCTITIETVNDGTGIRDDASVVLYHTYIKCSAITSLSFTAGKFNVLNDITQDISDHNGIFRGKCLNGNPKTMYPILPIGNTKNLPGGGYTIEQVMANIAAGNFADIYIGDYFIDINNKVYRIAGLDTEVNKGDAPLRSHHAVIVTDFVLTNMSWNPTNTTAGGYKSSAVQAYCDGDGQVAIESVFGAAHVLTVRDMLSSDMNASAPSPGYAAWQGVASAREWSSHKVRLMSEVEVYGARVWSGGYDIGTANEQFPLFRLMPRLATGLSYNYWLSGIVSADYACHVDHTGIADFTLPNNILGVRVRFLVG